MSHHYWPIAKTVSEDRGGRIISYAACRLRHCPLHWCPGDKPCGSTLNTFWVNGAAKYVKTDELRLLIKFNFNTHNTKEKNQMSHH